MPNIRKVAASVAAGWDDPPALALRPKDDRYIWVDRPAVLYIGGKPRTPRSIRIRAFHSPDAQNSGRVAYNPRSHTKTHKVMRLFVPLRVTSWNPHRRSSDAPAAIRPTRTPPAWSCSAAGTPAGAGP